MESDTIGIASDDAPCFDPCICMKSGIIGIVGDDAPYLFLYIIVSNFMHLSRFILNRMHEFDRNC